LGFLTKPSITQVNPNSPDVQGLQGGISEFLGGLFGGGESPFAGVTSDLQRGATGGLMQMLSANPEQQTLDMLQPGLMDLFSQGASQGITQAALPIFAQGLQRQLGGASSGAPGRFSTAFASQGIDLASRAAQDFNLFQQQARQADVANQLGAGSLLGSLAGQAGSGMFGRNLAAGQLGGAQTQQMIDPQLQLLLGGLGFARPAPMDTVAGPSPLDIFGQLGALFQAGRGS
jgi:hypothetical protein